MIRFLFLTFIFTLFCFGSYEKISIGKIDPFFEDKISKNQLQNILLEIEEVFERQLNRNIFDYSPLGKPIELKYLAPSKVEKLILKSKKKKELKEKEFKSLQDELSLEIKEIRKQTDIFSIKIKNINSKIKKFNSFMKKYNSQKKIDIDDYNKIKKDIEKKKKTLDASLKKYKNEKRGLKKLIDRYNRKVIKYNNLVLSFNNLTRKIEQLRRSYKKVKGKTFGVKKTNKKTFYKNGKKQSTKIDIETSMDKIEIYGFDNLTELKVVLAHEIAHLLGIPHINKKGALMNPLIQEEQIKNLSLSKEDIKLFNEHF